MRPLTDNDIGTLLKNNNPRFGGNFQIPTTSSTEEPRLCLTVNAEWLPHLIGALSVLDQPDAWSGTEAEVNQARSEVRRVIALIGECSMIQTRVRQNSEDVCLLEVSYDGGGTWEVFANTGLCVQAWFEGIGGDEIREIIDDKIINNDVDMSPEELEEINDYVNGDLGKIYSGCVAATKYIFDVVGTFCDFVDGAADMAEAALEIGGVIGKWIKRIFPPAWIMDIAIAIAEFGASIIKGQLSEANRLKFACYLFCRILDNNLMISTPIIKDWIIDIAGDSDLESAFAAFGCAIVCQTSVGTTNHDHILNEWTLVDARQIFNFYALGSRNSDNRWEILCTDCPQNSQEWLSLGGDGEPSNYTILPFNASSNLAVYNALDDRIDGGQPTQQGSSVTLRVEIPETREIVAIYAKIEYRSMRLRGGNEAQLTFQVDGTDIEIVGREGITSNILEIDWAGSVTPTTGFQIIAFSTQNTIGDAAYCRLVKLDYTTIG